MTDLIFIRHGETDWNLEGRWQGQADVPLNAAGLAQADLLARQIFDRYQPDAIYSSDLVRARQTAEPLALACGLPVLIDTRLREIHQGEWQGMLVTDIRARYGSEFENRHSDPWRVAPPGGETAAQVRDRLEAAIRDITAAHPQGTVLIFTHGFIMAVARVICDGAPLEQIWDLVPEHCTPFPLSCARIAL